MFTMSDTDPLKRMYVRANEASRRALRLVRARLLADPLTEDVSQEEVVAASWLWMAGRDPEELARDLAPHVSAIRASLALDDPAQMHGSPETIEVPAHDITPKKAARKRG
jgi:hypothetical protein